MIRNTIKQFWGTFTISTILATISLIVFKKCAYPKIIEKISILTSLEVNYATTVLAFAITAFSILQFISHQEWFSEFRKTKTFQNLIHAFWFVTIYHVVCVGVLFIEVIFFDFFPNNFKIYSGVLSIFMISFSLLSIVKIVKFLFLLLKNSAE